MPEYIIWMKGEDMDNPPLFYLVGLHPGLLVHHLVGHTPRKTVWYVFVIWNIVVMILLFKREKKSMLQFLCYIHIALTYIFLTKLKKSYTFQK